MPDETSLGWLSTDVPGSAGYVEIEQVTGTLHGRSGTFALLHTGTMSRGTPSLSITVVPDSCTGALAGLTGTMAIVMAGGTRSPALALTTRDIFLALGATP